MTAFIRTTLPALLAGLALAACQPATTGNDTTASASDTGPSAETSTEKVYNVAMNANFPPFESTTTNGDIVGFDVDVMNAMAKAGGFKVKYKNQPWDGIFATLTGGENDILISGITITDERKQTMAFTRPYFEVKQVILVPKGQNLQSAYDLQKLDRVGVTTGTTADTAAQKILGTTSPKIARFESLPLVIKDIENGGLQAMISDSAVVAHYIKNNSDQGFSMIEVPDFPKEEYGIAVRLEDQELLKLLDESLQKIRDSGEYDRIYSQYFAQ